MDKPLLCVSACLAGENVRYDGRSVFHPGLWEFVTEHFTPLPFCPEVEAGLPVPRPPMDLFDSPLSPRAIDRNGEDHTFALTRVMRAQIRRLCGLPVCGALLKSRSPSCAVCRRIPVFDRETGRACGESFGLFARMFLAAFEGLPVADEHVLAGGKAREEFLHAVLARHTFSEDRT
jgi:uncharacterized protein YbbK (DUF523 family)